MNHNFPCAQSAELRQNAFQSFFRKNFPSSSVRGYSLYCLLGCMVFVWLASTICGTNPISPTPESMFAWGANSTSAVQSGQWWRLISSIFIHAGVAHLVLNAITLWYVGRLMLRYTDDQVLLLVFIISGLVGNAVALHFGLQARIGAGASAAVHGLIGALLPVLFRAGAAGKERRIAISLVVLIITTLVFGVARNNIELSAHIGGLSSGLIMGFAHRSQSRPIESRVLLFCAAIGLMVTITICVTAQPAHRDIGKYYSALETWRRIQPNVSLALGQLDHDMDAFKSNRITKNEMFERMESQDYPAMLRVSRELSELELPQEELIGKKTTALARLTNALTNLMAAEISYSKTPSQAKEIAIRNCAAQVKLARNNLESVNNFEKIHSDRP